jgi:hypothetical protein
MNYNMPNTVANFIFGIANNALLESANVSNAPQSART